MGLGRAICYGIARRRALHRTRPKAGCNLATFKQEDYLAWRAEQLREQLHEIVTNDDLEDRDVLDFGCGHGDLTFQLAQMPVRSLTAIDVSEERILLARKRAAELELPFDPLILQAEHEDAIDLPDASMDEILCFDVLEHLMKWRKIVHEWARVLRSRGRVHVWWVPWGNPWGHHVESLVPIPWAHLLFSERTLVETCARIYEDEAFVPRIWDLDENGQKKPNKWRDLDTLPELNRLTIRRFERFLPEAGLRIEQRRVCGFGGSAAARATRPLTRLPVVGELFVSHVTYRLVHA